MNANTKSRSYALNRTPAGARLVVTDAEAIRHRGLPLENGDVVTTLLPASNAGFRGIEVCVVDSQGRKFFSLTAGAFALAQG